MPLEELREAITRPSLATSCGRGYALYLRDGFPSVFVYIFWSGCLGCFVLIFFFVFIFFEIFSAPGVFAERSLVYRAGIDDHAGLNGGFEIDSAEVRGGGLQGVEQESGDFRIELPGEDKAHDLHERDLDGVGVLEHGHGEAERGGGLGVQRNALALPVLVKETEAASAESRGAALGAVGFDMSAARDMNVVQHEECSTPLPHGLME